MNDTPQASRERLTRRAFLGRAGAGVVVNYSRNSAGAEAGAEEIRAAGGRAIAAQADGYQPVVALDACGTFSHHKREAGLARLTAIGIEVSDYATTMVEIMADNADPKASDVYAALDMPFATLMGQVAAGLAK